MNKETVLEVTNLIRSKYKSDQSPDFSFVGQALERRPYREIIGQLRELFQIEEDTDPNDDVSFGYVLKKSAQWVLRLSMLGPYAVLFRLDDSGRVERVLTEGTKDLSESEKELVRHLVANGIRLMDPDTLQIPVILKLSNTEPENTRIFQALFSDTDVLPWEEEAS